MSCRRDGHTLPDGALYLLPDDGGLWVVVREEGTEPGVKFHLTPAMVQQVYDALGAYLLQRVLEGADDD